MRLLLNHSNHHQVGLFIHIDPPVAHTINIEPLTPEDWESMVCRVYTYASCADLWFCSHRASCKLLGTQPSIPSPRSTKSFI